MSYKFEFFLRLFFMLFNILTYYFMAKLIGSAGAKYLEPYGGDYFAFVLIGIAFSTYQMVSLHLPIGIPTEFRFFRNFRKFLSEHPSDRNSELSVRLSFSPKNFRLCRIST